MTRLGKGYSLIIAQMLASVMSSHLSLSAAIHLDPRSIRRLTPGAEPSVLAPGASLVIDLLLLRAPYWDFLGAEEVGGLFTMSYY